MSAAFIDSSCVVAIAFSEPGARAIAKGLEKFDRLFATNLLEAEVRSALAREAEEIDPAPLFSGLTWVWPDRPLGAEMTKALAAGRLRGADLWHVSAALWLAPDPHDLVFATLDLEQAKVARQLGFVPL